MDDRGSAFPPALPSDDQAALAGLECTEIAGVRIIGAALWTDLKLYPELEELAHQVVTQGLNDYHQISMSPGKLMTGEDMLALHKTDKAAVFDALRRPFDGITLVVTHHLPISKLVHPGRTIGRAEKRAMNAGFAVFGGGQQGAL